MQMPDVHVLRVAGQGIGGMKNGVFFCLVQVSGLYLACQEKITRDQIVDACLKAHVGILTVPYPMYLWGKYSIPREAFSA